MLFKQIVLLVLLLCVMVFVVWTFFGMFAFRFRKDAGAMYVPSFDRHIKLMKEQLHLARGKKLVDLWCGDGKALRFFARTFGLQCDGYELQRFPYLYGKLLNTVLWYPDLKLLKQNFLLADIHGYDYIYVYLLPKQMAQIESRIFEQMGQKTIIISNSFQFAIHKSYDTICDRRGKPSVFLYKKSVRD